jgi:monofunctional biosynthetic peptidoglycan transglycosylase
LRVPPFCQDSAPEAKMSEDLPDDPWTVPGHGGRTKKIAIASVIGLLGIVSIAVASLVWGLPDVTALKNANPKSTALMDQRLKTAREAGESLSIKQKWVQFDAIPQMLKDTVRISEDAGFYHHRGIDLGEIRAAVRKSWKEKKPLRGASTITQQLAKNLYLSPKRSLWRKIEELLITRRLEAALSKNRIYHLYLNVIEFGPGIFGVEAAANAYFGKPVEALNLEEIVRLVAVIPKPLKSHPLRDDRWMKWRARWILDTLKRYRYINAMQHRSQIQNFK